MACVASCEEDVLLLCRKYDISRPTVHEVMKDAEKLNKTFESRSISLMLEVRLVTALANHPCLLPENPLNAEVQVNSLLPYLSSPCRWVRSLACSLLRVFTLGLDPNGQHFETQVTIICKNLQTTYEDCSSNTRFNLCQVIACSSLCSVTISCAALLPLTAVKFVLLTLRTVLNILSDPVKCTSSFLYQVAIDGLAKLFKCPATWNSLSVLEKRDAVTEYLQIFFDQSPSTCKTVTDTTMAKMLEVFDNSDVLSLILNLPDSRQTLKKLLIMLLELLPPISTSNEIPLLNVRWKSLSVIYKMIQLVKTHDFSKLDSLFDRACCDPQQISQLKTVLRNTFTDITF
ncbi:unnamed protein product [Porites evermanni]|uniref:Uncharacterized protein n=1 Tax=Porites evermanni TaxID=104178 RepID=A0ABN8LQM3_9CNID|nr:unnamed protein product [Porites evermanni]